MLQLIFPILFFKKKISTHKAQHLINKKIYVLTDVAVQKERSMYQITTQNPYCTNSQNSTSFRTRDNRLVLFTDAATCLKKIVHNILEMVDETASGT